MKIQSASSQGQLQLAHVKADEEPSPPVHPETAGEKASSIKADAAYENIEDIFKRHGTFLCADINDDGRDEIIHQNIRGGVVAYTPHMIPDGSYESYPENHIVPDLMNDRSWKLVGAGRYGWHHSAALFFQHKSTGALIANTIGHDDFNENEVLHFPSKFPSSKYEVIGVADFNNDRHSDIFLRNRESGELFVWLLKEDHIEDVEDPRTVIHFETGHILDQRWKILGIGSFHKDGKNDIVARGIDGTTKVVIYQGVRPIGETILDGFGGFGRGHIVGVGDIDGDGSSDLLRLDEMGLLTASIMNGIYEQRNDKLFYTGD